MARKIRIEYADAAYHVIARGNQKRAVIADDPDRTMRLDPLGEACAKTGWRMNAYLLTGNHYHRLVEAPERAIAGRSNGMTLREADRSQAALIHIPVCRDRPLDRGRGDGFGQSAITRPGQHFSPAARNSDRA